MSDLSPRPGSASASRKSPVLILWLACVAAGVAVIVTSLRRVGDDALPEAVTPGAYSPTWPDAAPLPWPESPYENTRLDAQYVGSDACRDCHEDEYKTFSTTAHSQSLQVTFPDEEPPGGAFVHGPSHRRYEVYRDDSVLRHREVLLLPGNRELESSDFRMEYTVGSGRFGRTYLAAVDGFLVESPVTWYAPQESWGMSPGYDGPQHKSFQRFVTDECFFCHSGIISPEGGNPTRITFQELAIGCERCHGPGSLHVERHRSGSWSGDEVDLTIVNPLDLPQDTKEAVCAQCHRQGDAQALVRGRRMDEFRPGLPLSEFRADYWLDETEDGMSIVGHHGQLHQSRCYTASDGMSCLTCHDPHSDVAPEQRVSWFRNACLDCHVEEACGLSMSERERQAANDCAHCHMPKAATEVPHVAFTHHRIGIHAATNSESSSRRGDSTVGEFIALDTPDLPAVEKVRLRGLLHFMQFKGYAAESAGPHHFRRAQELLTEALQSGAGDVTVRAALAELAWHERDATTAEQLAESVVTELDRPTQEWVDALSVLAEIALSRQEFVRARDLYSQLTEHQYNARFWFYLGLCEQNCGETDTAITALEKSLQIDPVQTGAHDMLALLHRIRGEHARELSERGQSEQIRRFQQAVESSARNRFGSARQTP